MFKFLTLVALATACGFANAQKWQVISQDLATIIDGVAFLDDKVGFVPAGANGAGSEILKTTDAGKTWSNCPREGGFLLLNAGAIGDDIVVAGVFGEEYSDNGGKDFHASDTGVQSQCIRTDSNSGDFWAVGQTLFTGKNGVAYSKDGGQTWLQYDAHLQTDARYGAMPTAKTWYITAGNWPSSSPSQDDDSSDDKASLEGRSTFHLTEKIQLHMDHANKAYAHKFVRNMHATNESTYNAQIAKTTDGGKTWTTVFSELKGNFYFNGIDCADEYTCCAVGEADSGKEPGSRIYCTSDGGSHWNRTAHWVGPQYSLMDIRFVGPKEAWAAGGDMENFEAWFLHTTDGGLTWSLDGTVDGCYANSLDFPTPDYGYAAAFTEDDQSSVLAYR